MGYVLTFFHIIVCVVLIAVVLLQTGKRADIAGAFGGGGSQTAFGARGAATLFSRITTWAAVIFMLTSFGLSVLASRHTTGSGSVLEGLPETPAPVEAPAAPPAGTAPAAPTPAPEAPAVPPSEGN
jgi:preprotein translocase subunit SecG